MQNLARIPKMLFGWVNIKCSANTRLGLLGVSGFSLFMIGLEERKKQEILALVALKKERLQMPVYELTGDELVNFPWNHDNLDQWLYRPVKFKGRHIHRQAIRVPFLLGDCRGFHYIVPICTQEPEDHDPAQRNGVL